MSVRETDIFMVTVSLSSVSTRANAYIRHREDAGRVQRDRSFYKTMSEVGPGGGVVNLHGLKAVACVSLLRPLLLDIFPHGGFTRSSDGLDKVAIRPQAVSPEEFLQLRELFSDHLACSTFQILDGLREIHPWRELEEHMHMVRHDGQFVDVPSVHFAAFVEQPRQASDELPLEDPPPVLGDEYHMVQVPMHGMAAAPKDGFGHTLIVAQWAEDMAYPPR